MKVIFLTPTLEIHGGVLIMARYANYLAELGHQVSIISPLRGNYQFSNKINVITYSPVSIRYLDTVLFQLPYWRKISSLIGGDTDVIIPIYTPLLLPAAMAKVRKKLHSKIILLAQEAFEMFLIGSYNKFLMRLAVRRGWIDKIVTVSEPLMCQIREYVPNSKPVLLPNGVELNVFKLSSNSKQPVLLFVGRPNQPKGFPVFVEVFTRLKKQIPELRARVIAPIKEFKLPKDIEFVSYANRSQLAKEYQRALVYINTSVAESFSLPPLEAMACGTAVVMTDTIGPRQYAVNGVNCLVAPVNDVDKLVEATRKVINDNNLRLELIRSGLQTAREFDSEKTLKMFAQIVAN